MLDTRVTAGGVARLLGHFNPKSRLCARTEKGEQASCFFFSALWFLVDGGSVILTYRD